VKTLLALLALLVAVPAAAQQAAPIPRLETRHGARQLIVDGQPWLILGGELANSSASSRDHMRPVWPRLRAMNLNTVLMPVSWELIEPAEGRFDFALVDSLLADARTADLRVVILWFGSWKNSMSSYAPAWVKRDQARFPRARAADGSAQEILTPFAPANVEADARAFAALMQHLAETDHRRTVIMVQIENEIGMIPDARDHSAEANAAFAREGRGVSDEEFMAHAFARATERVAATGKAAWPLPMYVNAALPRPGAQPGSGYPSAGPLPQYAEIWRREAPSINFIAPDIYFPNFVEWVDRYAAASRPLFIPEANRAGQPEAGANALYAIGRHDALGFSPFSIDNVDDARLAELYAMLRELSPLILAQQGRGTMTGVRPPVAFDGTVDETPRPVTLGNWRLTFAFVDPWTPRDRQLIATHGGLVIQLGPDEFLIAGQGVTVTFAPASGDGRAGIESIWEGRYVAGRWVPGRLLNGDESHQGRHLRLPPGRFNIQRVRLYPYR
jgi:beta-galactosidase GanA